MYLELVKIRQIAELLTKNYQDAAAEYQREKENRRLVRGKHEADALHSYKVAAKLCQDYGRALYRLCELVPKRLAGVWPCLQIVPRVDRWHERPEFNWMAAHAELHQIIEAAAQAIAITPVPDQLVSKLIVAGQAVDIPQEFAQAFDVAPHDNAQPKAMPAKPQTQSKRGNRDYDPDASQLVLPALLAHHQYNSDGSILNTAPITLAALKSNYNISKAVSGRWFASHFGDHKAYQVDCVRDKGRKLRDVFRKLNQDDAAPCRSLDDYSEPTAASQDDPEDDQDE